MTYELNSGKENQADTHQENSIENIQEHLKENTAEKLQVCADPAILVKVEELRTMAIDANIFEQARVVAEVYGSKIPGSAMMPLQVQRWVYVDPAFEKQSPLYVSFTESSNLARSLMGRDCTVGQATIKLTIEGLDDLVVFDAERYASDANKVNIKTYLRQDNNTPQGNYWETALGAMYKLAQDKKMKTLLSKTQTPMSVQDKEKYESIPKNFGISID